MINQSESLRGEPPFPRRYPDIRETTILHASDLHFGPHFIPEVGQAFRLAIPEIAPDLMIISGDLTHRAKPSQFRSARQFLDTLPDIPQVIIPGNHDVPLYRVWERILAPYQPFQNCFGEIRHTWDWPGGKALLLNTTHPWLRIVEGKLSQDDLQKMTEYFQDDSALKIIVGHHPLLLPPGWRYGRALDPKEKFISFCDTLGVDCYFSGHLHWSHAMQHQSGLVLIQAGTATTTRGRGPEKNQQTFNHVQIRKDFIEVQTWGYDRSSQRFRPNSEPPKSFPRRNRRQ
jgi:3',5'-cyclic AMP phosphodiesterase CpdA